MEEYSASATTVTFSHPIPLLRGPVPAGGGSEPGQYVLAFRSMDSWTAAYKRCEALIKEQCEEGARIGCAVSASNNCKPPWWRRRFGAALDMRERDKCEEREFKECLAVAEAKCSGFAKEKCSAAFLDARVAVATTEVERLVWIASMPEESRWVASLVPVKRITNRRARDLLLQRQNRV